VRSAPRRTLLVYPVPALVVAALWLRLERPAEVGATLGLAALALVPALAPSLRPRVAALFIVSLAALGIAFELAPQRHPAETASRFADGFLDFYDVRVPFDPRVHAAMHGTILVAVFGFCAALALAVAARRAPAAVLVLLVGAGWPATLLAGGNEVARGALVLLATLVLLVGLSRRPTLAAAAPAALVLVLLAAGVASSPAVAKRELVAWQRWDFYNRPDTPVGVSFVWNSQYDGIHWPKKKTVVLEVKGPSRALYWRAATLDAYDNDRWLEAAAGAAGAADSGLPPAAADPANQLRTEVKVEALADDHLVGASEPVRFAAGDAPVLRLGDGVALIPGGLTRGFTYTVWSYAPNPSAHRLVRSRPLYPPALIRPGGYLDLTPGVAAPPFGVRGRPERLRELLDTHAELYAYRPLATAALRVAGRAKSPYAAAVSLESWLRFRGGFVYSNRGYQTSAPPLVGFVVQTKHGYCQYFAGAMALMLRYLGVPARVAVGFTSGDYNPKRQTWTVTDHDAHAWVEAWFRGYGWLPFDPTPGRGRLGSVYSASAPTFLSRTGAKLLSALGLGDPADIALQGNFREPGGRARAGLGTDASGGGGGASAAGRSGSVLALLALVLLAAAAAVAASKLVVRRSRYLSRDPRRIATACRRELSEYLLDQRIEAARSATLHELGRLVRDELLVDATAFVAAASAARFGPPAGAAVAARTARRELRRLEGRLHDRLTPYERFSGLLSLRSLGIVSAQ
jgi:transglutaminase-like putative cysteine protease